MNVSDFSPKNLILFTFSRLRTGINHLSKVRHEIVWVVIGQFLVFVGGFASVKILTNIMGPEEYGQLALGMTIADFLNLFAYGPVGQVVLRFFSIYRERNALEAYFFILKKSHLFIGLFLLVGAAFAGVITNHLVDINWALMVFIAILFGIVMGMNGSFLMLHNAIRERKIVALHKGANAWLRVLLAVALIYIFGNKGYFALLGYLLGIILITLSQRKVALKNDDISNYWNGEAPDKETLKGDIKEFFAYASPFALWASFAAISMYTDRWIIQGFLGSREVGIYFALYQIAYAPIVFIAGFISQLILPIIFEKAGAITHLEQAKKSGRLLGQAIAISVILYLLIVVVFYFFSKSFVVLLTSSVFAESHRILWIIALSLALFNIGQLLTFKGLYYKQPRIYIWPKVMQAVTLLILAFFLVQYWGILGIVLALCGSSFLYLASVLLVNSRISHCADNI